jgi:uncharacterized protein (DUF305 family)
MKTWRLTAVLLLGLPVAAAQEGHGDSAHVATEHVHASDADERGADYDLTFLAHMIVHHRQAIEMAALVPARSKRDEFVRFARRVDAAQRAEIEQMQALLDAATARGREPPTVDMRQDPPMQGMLSKRQMAALAEADGPAFEALWLRGMIFHHEGALAMARTQQEWQFANGRSDSLVDVMADHILDSQRAEIRLMERWLAEWGLQESREP